MQSVQRGSADSDPRVSDHTINQKRDQQNECNEQCEDGQVKPERLQSAGKSVIDREQRRNQRTIRLIARERAERGRVYEKPRNILWRLDRGVVNDRVCVVEVKAVLKMVRVGCEQQNA